jgi:hypothetical protein
MLLDIILEYHIQYHICIRYDIKNDIRYDFMTSASLRSRQRQPQQWPLCVASSLSCPAPALADTLVPDPLGLCDGHHPKAPPAVAPHPDVPLIEPAAVAPVPLRVGRGGSKTPIVLEAVRNSG